MGEFSDLIPEFVEESLEHLKNIEEDIIIIEQGTADNELINRVFRAVHSIKGGSSFLGLKNIEHLSHKMEDIFNLVRNDDLEFTSRISSSVLTAIDKLKEMLERSESSDDFDISSNLKDLEKCLSGSTAAAPKEIRAADKGALTTVDTYTLDSLRKKGKKIYCINFELKEDAGGKFKSPLEFFRELEKTGEILEKNVDMELVSDESFTGEGVPLSIVYATVLEEDLVAHILGVDSTRVKELKDAAPAEKTGAAAEAADTGTADKDVKLEPKPIQLEPEIEEEEEEEEEDPDIIKEKNEYLTFLVGDEEYGIGITQVHEIITMQEITRLPGSEDFTRGIVNLRGDIIPVYDFRLKLQFEEREYDYETIILIVMIHEKKAGIIVDRVSEVIQLNRDQITDAPQMQQIPSEFVIGIGQKEGKFVVLLKVAAIFNIDKVALDNPLGE
jgi:chemotaxis signal transduction protein/HPt (histidine-containing phosphotransfer) domain-containing protein